MNIIKPVLAIASTSMLCAAIAFSNISNVNASGYDAAVDSPQHHKKRGGHNKQMIKHIMKRMVKELSLTEQQQEQIKLIRTEAKEQHETLRESMKKFKGEEKALLQAQTFDEQAYRSLHTAYQPIHMEAALAQAKTKQAVFNVLTTEQQEKWLKLMEKRKEKLNRKRG